VRRRSARVVLLDPGNRILLIRFNVTRANGPFTFWATPGGAVEDGETDQDAARRELIEELHLDLPLEGPVHTTKGVFEHLGKTIENTDVFFVGRCDSIEPKLDPLDPEERSAMSEIRWWIATETEGTKETVFPSDLAKVVRQQAR
jgi:8-oxo-dGTP pyrophosphatase MutT (NUDIX family)